MFIRLRTFHNRDGTCRTYVELARSYRKDGKIHQEKLCSLGRLEELQSSGAVDSILRGLARLSERQWVEAEAADLIGQWSREYGPVLVFRRLWDKLGLHALFDELCQRSTVEFPVEESVFGMVLNRLLEPDSKLGAYEWLREKVYCPEAEGVELHHLYRALDFVDEHRERLEEGLFLRGRDLFHLEVDLVFFDTTSTYFEGEGPEGLAGRGYSRDKRPDLMQVMIGLVMTREGIPVAHHVFPGDTADITLFTHAIADLRKRFAVRRVVVVADRGVASEPLLEALDQEGIGYIIGIPLRRWKAAGKALKRAGRYHEVADNLRVKEVWEEGQRYVVCHNPEREVEDSRRRAEIVAMLEEKLKRGGLVGLAKRKGQGRYLEVRDGGEAGIDWKKVKEDERYDGKYVLRSNTEMSAEEIALAYKGLWRVEQGFREMKSGLELRPIRHWTPSRVRGHIMVCFLALVMESTLLKLMREQGTRSSYQAVLKDVEQVKAVKVQLKDKSFLLRTELKGRAYEAFQAVGLRPPPRVQPLGGGTPNRSM